jgi:hypothetical protein
MSTERWVYEENGKLFRHEENDGYAFLRHGPESVDEELAGLGDPWLVSNPSRFEEAVACLESAGYVVDRVNKTYTKATP